MSAGFSGPAYVALALAQHDAAWKVRSNGTRQVTRTLADRAAEGPDDVLLALACERLGLKDTADRFAKRIEKAALNDVGFAALRLQLQAARGENYAETLRFLLGRRVGGGWRTTMEGAYAMLGLSAVLARPNPVEFGPGKVIVQVNGKAAGEVTMPDHADPAFDGRISVKDPGTGKIVVRLTFEGKGTAFYTMSLRGLSREERADPVSRGLEVTREYFERVDQGWKLTDGTARPGSLVLVHLAVTSPVTREYVRITDPRPTGWEPPPLAPFEMKAVRPSGGLTDRVDLGEAGPKRIDAYRASARGDERAESAWAVTLLQTVIDDRLFVPASDAQLTGLPIPSAAELQHGDAETHFFVHDLSPGTSHFYYLVTVEQPGEFRVLPAEAEPMYAPEIRGASEGARLKADAVRPGADGSLALAPGVEGLVPVLTAIQASGVRIDADRLIDSLKEKPSIGALVLILLESAPENLKRAWLMRDAASGASLKARLDGAVRDSEMRLLALQALDAAPVETARKWDRLLQDVLAEQAVSRLGSFAVMEREPGVDNALAWASADLRVKLAALRQVQRIRGSQRLHNADAFRRVAVTDLTRFLGWKTGDEVLEWQLAQRVPADKATFAALKARLAGELGLKLKILSAPADDADATARPGETVSALLDRVLGQAGLYFRMRGDTVTIGDLDSLEK